MSHLSTVWSSLELVLERFFQNPRIFWVERDPQVQFLCLAVWSRGVICEVPDLSLSPLIPLPGDLRAHPFNARLMSIVGLMSHTLWQQCQPRWLQNAIPAWAVLWLLSSCLCVEALARIESHRRFSLEMCRNWDQGSAAGWCLSVENRSFQGGHCTGAGLHQPLCRMNWMFKKQKPNSSSIEKLLGSP